MAKFYIYYNHETAGSFCTTYEWNGPEFDSTRRYCNHIGEGRFTHEHIQLDVPNRVLYDKRYKTKYTLVEPSKDIENLQWETVEGDLFSWEDLGL